MPCGPSHRGVPSDEVAPARARGYLPQADRSIDGKSWTSSIVGSCPSVESGGTLLWPAVRRMGMGCHGPSFDQQAVSQGIRDKRPRFGSIPYLVGSCFLISAFPSSLCFAPHPERIAPRRPRIVIPSAAEEPPSHRSRTMRAMDLLSLPRRSLSSTSFGTGRYRNFSRYHLYLKRHNASFLADRQNMRS
jgi:hypothetical protein